MMNLLSGQRYQISSTGGSFSFERLIKSSKTATAWERIIQTPISHSIKPAILNESEAKIRQQVLQTQEIINQLANSIPSSNSLSCE